MRVLLGAALCVIANAAACGDAPPGRTFYQRNIEPILTQKCAGNTSGCHQANTDDKFQFAAGNLDVSSFENVQKRRDVLAPFGAYNYPLLLIKAVGPDQLTVQYGDKLKPIQVQHAGGAIIEVGSDAFYTLQSWLDNGATENGLKPATPAKTGAGDCSTAVPEGFVAATYSANPNFAKFVSDVQPVFDKHGCTAGSCHGAPQSDFYITCGTDDNQKAFNFSQAWSFVNNPVGDSQILRVPLAAAQGGRGHTGGDQFASTDDNDYKAIAAWATDVGVLDFAQGDPVKQFFKDNVQPILVQRGCSFQACHSASATNDFKLRSGTPQGFFSAVALEKNYELLLNQFVAIEFPDARRGRAIAKTILAEDPRVTGVAGIVHRGGPVLETPGSGPADPALCPKPWTDMSTPFCTVQEWITRERGALGLPLMAPNDKLPLVYVARAAAAPAGRLEFDTFQGGADLRVAQATLGAQQVITSVDVAGAQSLLGDCNTKFGIAAGTADVQAPDMGPDGTTVAFAARKSAADPLEVYTVGLDGTNCTQVTAPAPDSNGIKVHNFDPAWSPDGAWLVFASTRGKATGAALSRKRMLPQSDLWRVNLAAGTTEQITFLSNSEISPQTMREGRITMTTEKVSDGFYQLSGRRINWDVTDYHPLLAQRHDSPYADPTDPTQTKPSIGFDSATDIREGTDGSFLMILSDLDMDGKPALNGGAGALASFNRSLGPVEQGRTDAGYLPSVRVIDPSGTASGQAGAATGYRAPVDLPDGTIMVSFTSNPAAPTWKVVAVDPRTNTQVDLIPNACDAVAAYPYPARTLFTNHRQLVFGGAGGGDADHAIVHMPDAPLLFTLLTGNLRRGRPVDAFRAATHLQISTEAPCPPGTSCPATSNGVFQQRMVLGKAQLASDGSVRVEVPSRTGVVLALVDDSGKEIVTMTEEHQLGPGETISMGVSESLFNSVCAGCHGSIEGSELDVGVSADALTGASQSLSATATPTQIGN